MSTRLRRTVFTRVMGGAWFQWLLTLQLAVLAWAPAAGQPQHTGRDRPQPAGDPGEPAPGTAGDYRWRDIPPPA